MEETMAELHSGRVQTLQPEGHLYSLALPFQVNGLKLATLLSNVGEWAHATLTCC